MKVLFLVALVLAVQSSELDLRKILKNIPEHDRVGFLQYHIEKGFEVKYAINPEKQYKYGYSDKFSLALYKYFEDNAGVIKEQASDLTCVICWNNKCVDVCNPGNHP